MKKLQEYIKTLIMAVALLFAMTGCADEKVRQLKNEKQKLENKVSLLEQQMNSVKEIDKAAVKTTGEMGCGDEKSFILLRTRINCTRMQYAAGFKNFGLSLDDSAIWAEVLAVANAYSDIDEKNLGSVFEAVRGAVDGETFRKKADPHKVLIAIRQLPGTNTKDFYAILADTATGKTTILSRNSAQKEATPPIQNQKHTKARGSETNNSKPRKWTYDQAMKEACSAGKQYREDVDLHGMKPSQAENEAKEYSQYLASNSPAPRKTLYDKIKQGLWMDSCI